MRLLLASLACEKGDLEGNVAAHAAVLERARSAGCHLAVFPELSLTGSVRPDLGAVTIHHPAVAQLVAAAQYARVAALFGLAERVGDGAYISQAYAVAGGIAGVQRKRRLGEDEAAYTAADDTVSFHYGSATFAAVICAESSHPDVWDSAARGASLVVLCAAPGLYRRMTTPQDWRDAFEWWSSTGLADARTQARRLNTWVAAVSQAGSTRDEDFPGGAALVGPDGDVVRALPDGRAGELVVDVPVRVEMDPVRSAVRVLVVDDDGRTLLVHFSDDSTGRQWWFPPGGGVEPGEDDMACARRELEEELGRVDLAVGPAIGRREATFPVNGRWISQSERWYLCRCRHFQVGPVPTPHAVKDGIQELRWWSAEEIRAAGVDTAPRDLAAVLDAAVAGRTPGPDTDLGR